MRRSKPLLVQSIGISICHPPERFPAKRRQSSPSTCSVWLRARHKVRIPYLMIAPVVFASILFDRGIGFLAAALGVVAAASLVDWRVDLGPAVLILFAILALLLTAFCGALRKVLERGAAARQSETRVRATFASAAVGIAHITLTAGGSGSTTRCLAFSAGRPYAAATAIWQALQAVAAGRHPGYPEPDLSPERKEPAPALWDSDCMAKRLRTGQRIKSDLAHDIGSTILHQKIDPILAKRVCFVCSRRRHSS
jgi:hypothetical protein